MAELGRSRRVIAQRLGRNPDEGRAYLQDRLAIFSKLLFWSFAALLVFLFALYRSYPDVRPRHQDIVYVAGALALGLLAILWRLLLVRKTLSVEQLYGLDLFITCGAGATFGVVAVLTPDLHASAYTCLIYQVFVVFTRALLVPGSARRTAIVSASAFVPLFAGSIVLAAQDGATELPGIAFVGGAILLTSVAVLLAATGSRIIYGLRRQVSQLGQYTLGAKIGEGATGDVHQAHHLLLRRPTAIKVLKRDLVGPENLERFEREVQHMSQLTHPNTVAVFDYGYTPEGSLYYAMEFLGGGIDLEQLVRRFGVQPSGRVVQILLQVCGALQEAHELGFIHRDIKPANIILCERGRQPDVVKVVDFGLVKKIEDDAGASTQIVRGTPHYIAPEAVTDPDNVGPAVDLYAVGAVGYYLLTAQFVFDVWLQHLTKPPVPPSQRGARISPELDAIILRCLAKKPSARFASARELADALVALPPANDWSRDEATRWWRDFERVPKPPTPDAPTRTITVDVGQRELAVRPPTGPVVAPGDDEPRAKNVM